MALYYFMGIQRDVKTELLFRCVWPYVVLLIAALAIAIAVPDTVMVFVRTLMRTR
jgi:TRAP-type mannitol/chloroaromatic compound transport system permease large subunit